MTDGPQATSCNTSRPMVLLSDLLHAALNPGVVTETADGCDFERLYYRNLICRLLRRERQKLLIDGLFVFKIASHVLKAGLT